MKKNAIDRAIERLEDQRRENKKAYDATQQGLESAISALRGQRGPIVTRKPKAPKIAPEI